MSDSSQSVSFDRAVSFYDQTRGFPTGVDREAVQLFVQAGGLTSTARILEIGAGTGRIALPLAHFVGEHHAVDISSGMLSRLLEKRQHEPVYPVQADIIRLPYADQQFDAVTAVHIFHLVGGWQQALNETARVLKQGGVLLHGWGARTTQITLQNHWETLIANTDYERPVGAHVWNKRNTFLYEAGWSDASDILTFDYQEWRAPNDFIDALRKRIWSSTWYIPDDILNDGITKMTAFIAEHYDDPSKPEPLAQQFHVRAYTPPA